MRWLVLLLLWIAAIVVALLILRRVRRGKPIVMAGRWSPRLVRMIAVVLVVLGMGEEAATPPSFAAPAKLPVRSGDDELPSTVSPATVQMWLAIHDDAGPYTPGRRALIQALSGRKLAADQKALALDHARFLGPKLQKLLLADLAAIGEDKPLPGVPAADLRAALDELEKSGRFDHYWNGYLWRKTATAEFASAQTRVELFARFRQHARLTDALIRAHAQVKPLMQPPRAWMSKAGPKKGDMAGIKAYQASLADMVKVANEALPTTDEGTWKRDAILLIKPVKDVPAPVLLRGGKERLLAADESSRVGRLDLLQTGDKQAAFVHDWLGKVELPANRTLSTWDLPNLLPDAAKQKLDETVHDALKNNSEDAADRLERCLPLSHHAIRAGLKELPNAKGAPRLRLILALFDDAVMPALPSYRAGESLEELGDRRGAPGGR
jgi:hypothetical protein